MIPNYTDFKSGYAVDLPPEQFEPGMMAAAENLWWVDAPVKREGHSQHSDLTAYSNINGFIQAYINSTWYTVAALDDGSNVGFYQGDSNVLSLIDSSPTFAQGYDVEFASLAGTDTILAVNGNNRPLVIKYADSAWDLAWLEDEDVRTRGDDEWNAGQYVDTSTSYVGDTADAQSAASGDFVLANSSTSNDGFYVACDFTFNTIELSSVDQFTGSPVAEYLYYKGNSTWDSCTMEQTPTWTDAAGDRTIEFTYPDDWETWDIEDDEDDPTGLPNKFVFRCRFTTAPTSTPTADKITVKDAQYFRVITADGKPQAVATHNSSYWLAVGNNVYWSGVNGVTGWQLYQSEYFLEGGNQVLSMTEIGDDLAIFKNRALYGFYGNQFGDAVRRNIAPVGVASKRSVVSLDGGAYFVAHDGSIYGFNGTSVQRLSRHIQSDLDAYTRTDCAGVAYKGYVFFAFPSNSEMILFDPDTYREGDFGEGRVSFYKWKSCRADQLIVYNDGNLYAIDDSAKKIIKYQNGNDYDDASTTIAYKLESPPISYGIFQQKKRQRRIKVDLSKSMTWYVTMKANHGTTTATSTISSGSGTGHWEQDLSIPYTMDGNNLAISFSNNTALAAKVYGYAVEVDKRRF